MWVRSRDKWALEEYNCKRSPFHHHIIPLTAVPQQSLVSGGGTPLPGPYLHLHVMVLCIVLVCILSCWRPGPSGGGDGQVSSRDEGAHVGVVGEDVVPDELTEEQHQVHKFHLLTFTVWIRWKETNSVKNQFPQLGRGKKKQKKND